MFFCIVGKTQVEDGLIELQQQSWLKTNRLKISMVSSQEVVNHTKLLLLLAKTVKCLLQEIQLKHHPQKMLSCVPVLNVTEVQFALVKQLMHVTTPNVSSEDWVGTVSYTHLTLPTNA